MIDALVANVGVVFEEYVNEVTIWQLVIESSEAVRIADLHLALWLKNGTITVTEAEEIRQTLKFLEATAPPQFKLRASNITVTHRECVNFCCVDVLGIYNA